MPKPNVRGTRPVPKLSRDKAGESVVQEGELIPGTPEAMRRFTQLVLNTRPPGGKPGKK